MDYASDNVFRCKFIWRGLVQVCSHLLSIRFIANGYIVVVLVFVCTSFFCTDELFPFLRLMVVNEKRMQHTLRFVASFRNERFVCIFSLSLSLSILDVDSFSLSSDFIRSYVRNGKMVAQP